MNDHDWRYRTRQRVRIKTALLAAASTAYGAAITQAWNAEGIYLLAMAAATVITGLTLGAITKDLDDETNHLLTRAEP